MEKNDDSDEYCCCCHWGCCLFIIIIILKLDDVDVVFSRRFAVNIIALMFIVFVVAVAV